MSAAPTGLPPRRRRGGLAELLAAAVVVATLVLSADLLFALFGLAGALAAELFLVLLPTLLVALGSGRGLGDALRLRRAHPAALAAALPLALGASLLGSALLVAQARRLPLPPEALEGWRRLEAQAAAAPLLALLALVVAPAVAEEALFRGLLLGALERRLGARRAVAASALVFALFHRSPHRLLAQGLLGLLLGAAAVRSGSLAPSVLLHLGYNLAIWARGDALLAAASSPGPLAAGVAAIAAGLGLLRPARPEPSPPAPLARVSGPRRPDGGRGGRPARRRRSLRNHGSREILRAPAANGEVIPARWRARGGSAPGL